MQLHKKLTEDNRVDSSYMRAYKNVNFGDQFFLFIEALENIGLYSGSVRIRTDEGMVWDDSVRAGGIKLVTEFHPSMNDGGAGLLTVCGSKADVTAFNNVIQRYATFDKP